MRKKRKRINISVDEITYAELLRVKQDYGFRSICQFSVTILKILCRYIKAGEARRKTKRPSPRAEITAMFNEMGNWEATPDGVVPKRHPRKPML